MIRFNSIVKSNLSLICWLLWALQAILFAINPYGELVQEFAVITLSMTVILACISPLEAVYLLPTSMLLGPIYSVNFLEQAGINSGDIVSIAIIFSPFLSSKRRFVLKSGAWILYWFVIFGLSTLYSQDIFASIFGLFKVVQFILITWVANLYLKDSNTRAELVLSWVLASTISAMLIAYLTFTQGPQFLLNWTKTGSDLIEFNLDSIENFIRPSFFYTGIYIPIGLSIVAAFWIILRRPIKISLSVRNFLIISIVVNFPVLLVNNTRAMLAPVLLASIYLMTSFAWKKIFQSKKAALFIVFFLLIIPSFLLTIPTFINSGVGATLIERSIDTSPMQARISLWKGSIIKSLDDPLRFLFTGYGPQATARQNSPELQNLRKSVDDHTEGAFDSTLIGVLIEYGLFGLVGIIVLLLRWFKLMYCAKKIGAIPMVNMYIAMAIIAIICSLFQQIGFAPPALMLLQLFSFRPNFSNAVRRKYLSTPDNSGIVKIA